MADSNDYLVKGPKLAFTLPVVSLGEYFFARIQEHGDKPAQVQKVDGLEVKMSFSDLLRNGKIVASLLRERGIVPGDTVAFFCGSTLDFLPIMLGTLFVGATISPINSEFEASDVLHMVGVVRPQLIITNKRAEPQVQEALTQYTTNIPVLSLETVAKRIQERPNVDDFYLGKVEDPVNDVAVVMCSSGTSGKPKGVELTHTSLIQLMFGSKEIAAYIQVMMNISGPYWVSCLFSFLMSLDSGLYIVVLGEFEENLFLEAVQQYKVNYTALGPSHLVAVAKHVSATKYDLSSMRVVIYVGSPMSQAMLDLAQKNLGTRVTPAYAMTECAGICSPAFLVGNKPSSVGKAGPNAILKVVDVEGGHAVGANTRGELWVKSPMCFKGYRGNPEATNEMVDKDGFMHTGDIVYYDEDGFFYVVDRIKELFKYKGIHVNAVDIEDVILQHPYILQAAVIGIPHEVDFNHAVAYVVRSQGSSVKEEDLIKLVEEQLPDYKWLHGGVRFIDDMPTTATGKINKNHLRKNHTV